MNISLLEEWIPKYKVGNFVKWNNKTLKILAVNKDYTTYTTDWGIIYGKTLDSNKISENYMGAGIKKSYFSQKNKPHRKKTNRRHKRNKQKTRK